MAQSWDTPNPSRYLILSLVDEVHGMTHNNTQRNPQSPAAIHSGPYLVYSRDWPKQRRMEAIAQHAIHPIQPRRAMSGRPKAASNTLQLTAAALVAPFAWAGHALLRALHMV